MIRKDNIMPMFSEGYYCCGILSFAKLYPISNASKLNKGVYNVDWVVDLKH